MSSKRHVPKNKKSTNPLTDTIMFSAGCGNCHYQNTINMPYGHAAKLFHGQSLNYVCTNCHATNVFDLRIIKETINNLPLDKKNHFFDYLSTHKEEPEKTNYSTANTTPENSWIMFVVIIAIIIGIFWFLSHSGLEENNDGMTNNYVCAYEANKLADESKELVQKMTDMRCTGIVTSDALYARCMELKAENDKKIRDWKALSCTDDSKLP